VLHRICAAAFAERNFDANGVTNRYMSLGYNATLLEKFHAVGDSADALVTRARKITIDITLDSARLLEKAIGIAERTSPDDFDSIERKTAFLGLEVAASDARWHAALDEICREMSAFAANPPGPRKPKRPARRLTLPAGVVMGMSVALVSPACGDDSSSGNGSGGSGTGIGGSVVDMAPGGMGGTGTGIGGSVVDMAPGGMGGMVPDPAPGGMGGGVGGAVVDMAPGGMGGTGGQAAVHGDDGQRLAKGLELVDHWRDSSARKAARTRDLPLYEPPAMSLAATRHQDEIEVELLDGGATFTALWQVNGERIGDGGSCQWRPRSPDEQICVAVRTQGGVAIMSLRADDVDSA